MATQPDGALYELVARGKKDVYFITSNPAEGVHPFNHTYSKIEPHLTERRTQPPRNVPQFGQSIEFELEKFGDILTGVTLLVNMPTWLPAELPLVLGSTPISSKTVNDAVYISTVDDNEVYNNEVYGWTNGIGYFLIDTLELYQDKILMYQTTGEALWLSQMTDGPLDNAYLRMQETGQHKGSNGGIAKNAIPGITDSNGNGQLRINIPWPGISDSRQQSYSQQQFYGFPLITTNAHAFRIKVKLKKMNQLIESSSVQAQEPWDKTFKYTDIEGNIITFQSLNRQTMKGPSIMLETRQAYLRDEFRRELLKNPKWEVPFNRWFTNVFPINVNDYSPLDKGGLVTITRRLEGVHPTSRILFMVRSEADLCNGRLSHLLGSSSVTNPEGFYWGDTKFLIAGKEREFTWDSLVYNKLGSLKRKMPLLKGTGVIDFSYSAADTDVPSGSINMSQADRPALQIQLLDAGTRQSEIYVVSEAWGIYAIQDGRGYVKFIN